jgi:hypothetical protein
MKRTPVIVTYYKAVPPEAFVTVMLFAGGPDFSLVTEKTDDPLLIKAAQLAKLTGDFPWRSGDGKSRDTQYGITKVKP